MSESLLERLAGETTETFFRQCPPPDAQWFVDGALKPIMRLVVATAIRAALDEAKRAIEEADCGGSECGYCGCKHLAVEAIEAMLGITRPPATTGSGNAVTPPPLLNAAERALIDTQARMTTHWLRYGA